MPAFPYSCRMLSEILYIIPHLKSFIYIITNLNSIYHLYHSENPIPPLPKPWQPHRYLQDHPHNLFPRLPLHLHPFPHRSSSYSHILMPLQRLIPSHYSVNHRLIRLRNSEVLIINDWIFNFRQPIWFWERLILNLWVRSIFIDLLSFCFWLYFQICGFLSHLWDPVSFFSSLLLTLDDLPSKFYNITFATPCILNIWILSAL